MNDMNFIFEDLESLLYEVCMGPGLLKGQSMLSLIPLAQYNFFFEK